MWSVEGCPYEMWCPQRGLQTVTPNRSDNDILGLHGVHTKGVMQQHVFLEGSLGGSLKARVS